MTGWPAICAAMTFPLMCSNWASRSGRREPSSAFRLDWRENPSPTSNLRTLLGLIAWPMLVSAEANLSRLFDTHSNGRSGSPRVAGSTRRSRSASSVGSRSVSGRGPPPSRRTRPCGSGGASRSFSPRPIVERASPVIAETAASPPRPAARASLAANTRRPRSSRFEPSAAHLCSIPCRSTMPPWLMLAATTGNCTCLSHTAAGPIQPIRFSCRCRRPYFPCGRTRRTR